MSRKRPGLWFTVCSVAIGVAVTLAGLSMAESSEDPGRRRLGEFLLSPASVMLPGLHDLVSLGFALVMNVVVIAAICWMTLWLCSVTLTLLQRLRSTSRKSTTP